MKQKHILVLFTDQQRYDTIGALGNDRIQTPNLDALVRDSVAFEHCTTPSPVCVPARLSMLSGQYPARTGCNNNNAENNYDGEGFYARLTESGYQSCCVGKMHHLPDPYGPLGFEKRWTQEELSEPEDDYTKFIQENYPWIIDYNGMRSEMYYVPQISQLPAKDHPTQWIGDKSVDFINNCDPDRPMLLVSSFIHPHPPYCPPSPWQKLYREDPPAPLDVPKEDLDQFWDMIGDRCGCERLMMSRQDILRSKNFYYACVSFVDYQIGRIIQALKDKGMYEDTLILFSSDHGDMMGDYNAIGKRAMVDSSAHIPFIIHYPGQEPGFRKDGAVTAQSSGIATVQPGYGNAAPLQLEFDPQFTKGEDGVERVLQLILAHFEQGGTLININVLNGEKLMEAHKDPSLHPDLVVRVTGFTAYFMSLTPQFRQLVVDRFLYGC